MTRHARFLRIEERRDEDAPESETADRARIAAVLGGAPIVAAEGEASLELDPEARAGDGTVPELAAPVELPPDADPPNSAPELAIEVARDGGQPFVRCVRCKADSTVHATVCGNCSAPLDTAEQRAFNDRLWIAHRQESERERAALAQMSAAREEHQRATVRPLPAPGMTPPPELGWSMSAEGGPYFFEVLSALSKPRWRWVAGALVVGAPVFLAALGGPLLSAIGWVLLLLLVLSMFPRRHGRRLLEWLRRGR